MAHVTQEFWFLALLFTTQFLSVCDAAIFVGEGRYLFIFIYRPFDVLHSYSPLKTKTKTKKRVVTKSSTCFVIVSVCLLLKEVNSSVQEKEKKSSKPTEVIIRTIFCSTVTRFRRNSHNVQKQHTKFIPVK